MKKIKQTGLYRIGTLFVFALIFSCSTLPYLHVNYRLPVETNALKGKKVFLSFEDLRQNKEILGKRAQEEFKSFSGNISFSVARGTEKGFKIGVFDLPALFMEAFKRRLESQGVEVLQEKKEGQAEIRIVLTDFLLDRVSRKWTFKMGYEARLLKGETALAKQIISGQSERVKLLGQREADIVVGESFTDLVNRLDVGRLFEQAGL